MLAAQALVLVGVPMRRVIRLTRDARDARYHLLRGYFHGSDDDTADELQQARLTSVTLPEVGAGVGCALGDLALPSIGVQVVSVRQVSGRVVAADDPLVLLGGDTLVLSGLPAALALAEAQLLQA
jgi:CPA2 family monovalent cation:H+ antiporter-2